MREFSENDNQTNKNIFLRTFLIKKETKIEINCVMPPKSAKKEPKCQWHGCDKCKVKIHQNKVKNHENECGSVKLSHSVFNETFTTSSLTCSLPPEFNNLDAPSTYLQRFVFIPETICSLCNFTMGCNLLIDHNGHSFVRILWTISDKYMDEIFTNSEGSFVSHEMRRIPLQPHFCFDSFRAEHGIR